MKSLIATLLCLWACTAGAQTTRYTVLFQDRPAGEQVTTAGSDGSIRVSFRYLDNGRGPDIKERMRLDVNGLPIAYEVTGKSTFGAPVRERFELKGERATWSALADKGEKAVPAPALYVPVESSLEILGVAAAALARDADHKLAALPDGELAGRKVAEVKVTNGARTETAQLHVLTGISIQPAYVWLTSGDQPRLFAFVYPGYMQLIESGFEPQADTLEAAQVKAEADLLKDHAQRLTHRLPDPILIRNVRVFDSEHGTLGEPADVFVYRGRVAHVAPTGVSARQPGTVIEGAGRTLLPGLFDMHTHEGTWSGMMHIAGGVTTARDMGNDNATLADLIARTEAGDHIGPHVVATGFIEGDSPHASRSGFVVDSVESAREAVQWYAQRGFPQIKLYNSFRPEWVEATAAEAHRLGLRVSGHVPAFMRAEQAVRAGYDELQHMNQVLLNFILGPKDDTRTLARFYLIGDKAHALDLQSPQVLSFVELLKTRGTVIDPTLATFEAMFNQKQGEMNPSFAKIASHVPIALQRAWRTNSMDVTEANAERYRKSYRTMLDFTAQLHRAGVPLVAGTDEIEGFTLHRELELYVAAGISPADALRIATWNGAKYTNLLHEAGSIAVGKRADLILIDGDPTRDISTVRNVAMVMKGAVVHYPAELYEAMGIRRFAPPPEVTTSTQ